MKTFEERRDWVAAVLTKYFEEEEAQRAKVIPFPKKPKTSATKALRDQLLAAANNDE
jgi:hypothetical protein